MLIVPDTPEASHLASTSPASSVLLLTPPDAYEPAYKLKYRFVHSCICFPCPLVERCPCYSQFVDPNIILISSIPQRPPIHPQPLPHHRFCCNPHLVLTSQHISPSTGLFIPAFDSRIPL